MPQGLAPQSGAASMVITTAALLSVHCYARTDPNPFVNVNVNVPNHPAWELAPGEQKTIQTAIQINLNFVGTIDQYQLQLFYENETAPIRSINLNVPVPGQSAQQGVDIWATNDGTASGTPRAGTYRLRVRFRTTQGPVSKFYNSDGTEDTDAAPQAGDVVTWAKGYYRVGTTPSSPGLSNVAAGGATPNPFDALDRAFGRVAVSHGPHNQTGNVNAKLRRSIVKGGAHRVESTLIASTNPANADTTHEEAASGTAAQRAIGSNRFTPGALSWDDEIEVIQVSPLSGFAWTHFEGVPAGYTASGTSGPAGLATKSVKASKANAWPYDNRHRINVLFYLQGIGNSFLNPPSSGDYTAAQRVFPEIAFLGVIIRTARGRGINDLIGTLKVWDSASLVFTESAPGETFTGTTTTRRSATPNSVPEDGVLPQAQTGVDRDKLPITWDYNVAGTSRVKWTASGPSTQTGLELRTFDFEGVTWDRNIFFIAISPNYAAVLDIHPENIASHGTHLTSDDNLIPMAWLQDNDTNGLVVLVESNGDTVDVMIERASHPTMRMSYFDFLTEVWVSKGNGAAIPLAGRKSLIRGNAHTVGGDPDIWTVPSHLGGQILQPSQYGEGDLTIILDIIKDGVHYAASQPVIFTGKFNKHNRYKFDPTGLKA